MPRRARRVLAGIPYYVTQRGVDRRATWPATGPNMPAPPSTLNDWRNHLTLPHPRKAGGGGMGEFCSRGGDVSACLRVYVCQRPCRILGRLRCACSHRCRPARARLGKGVTEIGLSYGGVGRQVVAISRPLRKPLDQCTSIVIRIQG